MKLSELIKPDLFNLALKEGYISERRHATAPLRIYNYTPKTQFEWAWDEATMNARGLIVDQDDNIVARPFKKFFTLEQLTELRNYVHNLYGVKFKDIFNNKFRTFEKVDGSLGVLYHDGTDYAIATRGSFESDQSVLATKILRESKTQGGLGYIDLPYNPSYTYLFEIIHPDNRIVVNYGDTKELVLIAIIETETGREIDLSQDTGVAPHFRQPQEYQVELFEHLAALEQPNTEGFVLLFDNGLRLKYKFEEYKRLHRIITNVSEKNIWELLKNGESIKDLLDKVPDEFYNWVKGVVADLEKQFDDIEKSVKNTYDSIVKRGLSKKDVALGYRDHQYQHLLFSLMDKKPIAPAIWQLIKPTKEVEAG